MAVSRTLLEGALKNNIVEIKWVRRIPLTGYAITRRALATNSYKVLNSTRGSQILNYRSPTQPNVLNTAALNLVTYWDLFRQEYRNISCESAVMSRIISVQTPAQIEKWWQIFEIFIRGLNADQRKQFLDS